MCRTHRSIAFAALGLVLAASCATTPHSAMLDKYPLGVIGRTTVVYYDVHGRSIAELRQDMRRQGPRSVRDKFLHMVSLGIVARAHR